MNRILLAVTALGCTAFLAGLARLLDAGWIGSVVAWMFGVKWMLKLALTPDPHA